MTQIQRKRLKRFIEFIKKIPPKSFRLDITCEMGGGADVGIFAKRLKNHERGATACCVGFLPIYNPKRFSWINDDGLIEVAMSVEYFSALINNPWIILEKYFGLTGGNNWGSITGQLRIFTNQHYNSSPVTPKMVARELEKVLKNDTYCG